MDARREPKAARLDGPRGGTLPHPAFRLKRYEDGRSDVSRLSTGTAKCSTTALHHHIARRAKGRQDGNQEHP